MLTGWPAGSLTTMLCGAVLSWLSNSRLNGVFAGPVSSLGSKPDTAEPTGAETVTTVPLGSPDGPPEPAGVPLGATEPGAEADGSPEAGAEPDGTGVAEAAGAYVQPASP